MDLSHLLSELRLDLRSSVSEFILHSEWFLVINWPKPLASIIKSEFSPNCGHSQLFTELWLFILNGKNLNISVILQLMDKERWLSGKQNVTYNVTDHVAVHSHVGSGSERVRGWMHNCNCYLPLLHGYAGRWGGSFCLQRRLPEWLKTPSVLTQNSLVKCLKVAFCCLLLRSHILLTQVHVELMLSMVQYGLFPPGQNEWWVKNASFSQVATENTMPR